MNTLRFTLRNPLPGSVPDLRTPGRRQGGLPGSRVLRVSVSARPRPPVPRGRRGQVIELAREVARLCSEARWQRRRHGLAAAYRLLGRVANGTSLRHAVPAR